MNSKLLHFEKIVGAVALMVVAGCTTVQTDSAIARPGEGVREFQRHVTDYRAALADCVRATEKLVAAPEKSEASAYAQVQTTAHRLEVVSVKARARADALEARGQEYFHEWAEEACAATDETSRREARARFEGLQAQFVIVQQDSRRVREDSRKFFDHLRHWRAALGSTPQAVEVAKARTEFAPAVTAGREALTAVDQLLRTLESAEQAVMKAAKP